MTTTKSPGFFFDLGDSYKGPNITHRSTKKRTSVSSPKNTLKLDCASCGLYKDAITPKQDVAGDGGKNILVICPPVTEGDDKSGGFLSGDSGRQFKNILSSFGFNFGRDFYCISALNCPNNSKKKRETSHSFSCCHEVKVKEAITRLKPKHVWLLGEQAMRSFYEGRFVESEFTGDMRDRWRGKRVYDRLHNCFVYFLWDPTLVFHHFEKHGATSHVYKSDIKRMLSRIHDPLPTITEEEKYVTICNDFEELKSELLKAKEAEYVAFDYETSGLEPRIADHKVWTIAFSCGENHAVAFPFDHPNAKWTSDEKEHIRRMWVDVLTSNSKKLCHNLKFEGRWSKVIFGVFPNNANWCSMMGAHVIDNGKRQTSLKFQSFINFGRIPYEKEMKPYMTKTDPETGLNLLDQAPLDRLLFYNGLDALFTYRLCIKQISFLPPSTKLGEAYKFYFDILLVLMEVEDTGVPIDIPYFKQKQVELGVKIDKLSYEIKNNDTVVEFEKAGKEFNDSSSLILKSFIYEFLKVKPTKTTATGKPSLDSEVLSGLAGTHPVVSKIVEKRKLLKVRDTYIQQFINWGVNDRVHPVFNLHLPATYRSSCSNPNIQNIPVHNQKQAGIVRRGVKPKGDNVLVEIDFSAIEVRVIAICTQDVELMKYIKDPSSDMHKDCAAKVFDCSTDEVTSGMRYLVKNRFVFPVFYGSFYRNCGESIWQESINIDIDETKSVYEYMMSEKSWSKSFFIDQHMRKVESEFWQKFSGVRKWQRFMAEKYHKTGYIDTLFGFRCRGILSRNAIFNYPIQGTAAHILLWSLSTLHKELKQKDFKAKIVMQIHDSIILECPIDERDEVLKIANDTMCNRVREKFPFINIPLAVEMESTSVGGGWDKKEK